MDHNSQSTTLVKLSKKLKQNTHGREDCIRLYCIFTQAAPLLLGKSYLGDDGPTHKEVYKQAQGCRKDDLVCDRT